MVRGLGGELEGGDAAPETHRFFRKPQRLTITVPWGLHEALLRCSHQQGRSVSNLACYWLERQAEHWQDAHGPNRRS